MGMIRNKKAKKDYHIIDKYIAGMQLNGSEIKSIRNGDVSINDSYCIITGNEVFIKDMHVKKFHLSNDTDYEPKRERKLLLTKKEIRKIKRRVEEKGMSLIPISIFVNEKGWAKINIALAQGKKMYDKRKSIKERDIDRDSMREVRRKF